MRSSLSGICGRLCQRFFGGFFFLSRPRCLLRVKLLTMSSSWMDFVHGRYASDSVGCFTPLAVPGLCSCFFRYDLCVLRSFTFSLRCAGSWPISEAFMVFSWFSDNCRSHMRCIFEVRLGYQKSSSSNPPLFFILHLIFVNSCHLDILSSSGYGISEHYPPSAAKLRYQPVCRLLHEPSTLFLLGHHHLGLILNL